jgi:2-oxoglutarate ferredoxin oxidoreductase subunit alpha
MVRVRARKVAGIVREMPPTPVHGSASGDLLVVGWGSTFGSIREAVNQARKKGQAVSHVHLRYLNPLPSDLREILGRFRRVLVPEMNLGQLIRVLRAEYLVDAVGLNKIQGLPFRATEIGNKIQRMLQGGDS